MSRQTMVEAMRTIPKASLYGIVLTEFDGIPYEYEVSWDDARRDFEWALEIVRSAGIGSNDYVLCATPNHELPWTSSFIRAFREVGATYVPVEQHSWDARRFVTVLQRLPITAIFGLWPETVSAVETQHPDLAALFTKVRMIWARPEAKRELDRLGVNSLTVALLGPALGVELPGEAGLRFNSAEWDFRSEEGNLIVSSGPERAAQLLDVKTGVSAVVESTENGQSVIRLLR